MKDLRCLFGFHDWENLPLSESHGNLITLYEKDIRNAQLEDMKIRTCKRCGNQHRGDASGVEMRVIASAFRPSPEVKDAEEEESEMRFEFTAGELERLTAFADGRGTCFDDWDEKLLQKLRGYISQAEAFEEVEG